jgi:two-component system response regulator VicR
VENKRENFNEEVSLEENSAKANNAEMAKKTILVVDDEKPIVDILTYNLQKEGYSTLEANDGEEAIKIATEKKPDLILLDIMLPKVDGLTVCKKLRHTLNVPILILSAKDEEIDKILGLELGADDYITKPFYHEEVLARIESVLRRCSESPQTEYSFKDIRINVDDHKVLVNNTELTLTTTEYNLLQLLIKHPKQTFTKESLYQLIWGKDYISDDNTLNVHISKLRKKLEHIGNQAPYIDTVWGIGYKLHR